ncbi:MAG TPA: aspartate--tRNA ligase [Oscillospiraceae bacterium]|nr:aspartate--tRNA ligase [Oscillospiraceae bacterium]
MTKADLGKTVSVCGWVARQRNLGGLIFVDLRDRTGIIQLAFDDATDRKIFDLAFTLRSEFVIGATGTVRERESKNYDIPTGELEVFVTDLQLFTKSETPPFEIIDNCNANEELRLRYRYLDLRRAPLQKNIITRHKLAQVTREYFYENGFIEIETPMMIKSTPEGARDYIVPSRIHPGNFYALPQSPQLYKQLLMLSGFDRYIQLARCFRDEDLRADRQPEFTQIDLEMSFVDVDDILAMIEGYMKRVFERMLDRQIELPIRRLTFADAMNRFGSDKPDLRFGMEIQDVSELVKDCGFGVFSGAVQSGGSVRCIVAKNSVSTLTRKEIDKLTETARGIGAKGLAYVRWSEDEPTCSFGKFLAEGELTKLLAAVGCEKGDTVLFVADKNKTVLSVLGSLRNIVAKQLDIIPKDRYELVWIVEMPFFEFDEESGEWVAMHHPFTMPLEECMPYLESDPGTVRAKSYDLVLNGIELLSGSIRINDPALQNRMFSLLGLTPEQIQSKFGFLVDAYRYGAPPHGGVGLGLDRLAMLLCGADSLRDVTAFPKVQNASELMSGCPSPVDLKQLDELKINLK